MSRIYLDWAATTPALAPAMEIYAKHSIELYGNASSDHAEGEEARGLLARSRAVFAEALGVAPKHLHFTSGATESNNIAILSLMRRRRAGHLVVSAIEHSSVYEPSVALENAGWQVSRVMAEKDGRVNPAALARSLTSDTRMVAVMLVNNESGAIQPIKDIATEVRDYAARRGRPIHLHLDAVQAVGKIPVNLADLDVDSASISAHKFRGPKGVGLLYARNPLAPLFYGGGQEGGLRPGTENGPAAAAAAAAIDHALSRLEENRVAASGLVGRILESMAGCAQCRVVPEERLANPENYSPFILGLAFPPLPGEVVARVMNDRGIALSTGSACSARRTRDTRVLEGMGLSRETAFSSVRVSIGETTSRADIDGFIRAVEAEIPILFKVAR